MAEEGDVTAGPAHLQSMTLSEEEISESNPMDHIIVPVREGTTQEMDALIPANGGTMQDMDAVVPALGGTAQTGDGIVPALEGTTQTGDGVVPALEGTTQSGDVPARTANLRATRLPEVQERSTEERRASIEAARIESGRTRQAGKMARQGDAPTPSGYSTAMLTIPEAQRSLSRIERAEIAAARLDFFERTGNTPREAAALQGTMIDFGFIPDPRLQKETKAEVGHATLDPAQLTHLREVRLKEIHRLVQLEKQMSKFSFELTLDDSGDDSSPSPTDENGRRRAKKKAKTADEEDVLARGSTSLQTAASEPSLLDFEINAFAKGFNRSSDGRTDEEGVTLPRNKNSSLEPGDGASAEIGEPSNSSDSKAHEENKLVRLPTSGPRPGELSSATHMELAQNIAQMLGALTISSNVAPYGGDGEQEQLKERAALRVCRSRARNRSDAQRRSGRSRYTRSQQFKTPSPDRRHSHSRPTSRSRTRYPTRIASSSTRQRSPAGLALAMDGFFSPRPNVRRPRERRANGEFLDFVSQTSLEKLTESD